MLNRPARPTRRARSQLGAAALLLLGVGGLLTLAAAGVVAEAVVSASAERASGAADAAAHAAEVAVMTNPARDLLSDTLQSGQGSCVFPGVPMAPASDPSSGAGPWDGAGACRAAFDAAEASVRANGATLVHFALGPDLRDRAPGAGAGRLEVLVEAAVPRALPGWDRFCRGVATHRGACWADAWSAAQERR